MSPFWSLYVDFVNVVDDSLVLVFAIMSAWQHRDLYNLGLILGKALKISVELYLEGYLYKSHKDYEF